MTTYHYSEGDTLTYVNFAGERITGKVVLKDPDIKNGRPGFDLDNGAWGYDSQIVRVMVQPLVVFG